MLQSRFRLVASVHGAYVGQNRSPYGLFLLSLLFFVGSLPCLAQSAQISLDRGGNTVTVEPYAPNILRITLSIDKAQAKAAPGFGFIAKPAQTGWSHNQESSG